MCLSQYTQRWKAEQTLDESFSCGGESPGTSPVVLKISTKRLQHTSSFEGFRIYLFPLPLARWQLFFWLLTPQFLEPFCDRLDASIDLGDGCSQSVVTNPNAWCPNAIR